MARPHDRLTIASFAVLAGSLAVLLHEGLGHGVVSWLRGDGPTLLTSNHLSDTEPDRLVAAGGTLVNLAVGGLAYAAHRRVQDSTWRYALWLFAALNLLPGAGYFLFSGALGVGDWEAVLAGLPAYTALRVGMTVFGAALYGVFVWRLARGIADYTPDVLGLWLVPYLAAAGVSCVAGLFDPAGLELYFLSTLPASFGGSSGLAWGHNFLRDAPPRRERVVGRRPLVWVAAVVWGAAYVAILGPGVAL